MALHRLKIQANPTLGMAWLGVIQPYRIKPHSGKGERMSKMDIEDILEMVKKARELIDCESEFSIDENVMDKGIIVTICADWHDVRNRGVSLSLLEKLKEITGCDDIDILYRKPKLNFRLIFNNVIGDVNGLAGKI